VAEYTQFGGETYSVVGIGATIATIAVDSDEVLSPMEAAELLGFATVQQGDIALTPLSDTFADAGILGRKGIFAVRIRRLPMFKWLLSLLRASDNHAMEWDVVKAVLGLEFLPDEAEKQLHTLVDWGRYAEVLAYDDSKALITLEPEWPPSVTMR
jgi:NitT/TauT family transport system ATP-binding protein